MGKWEIKNLMWNCEFGFSFKIWDYNNELFGEWKKLERF